MISQLNQIILMFGIYCWFVYSGTPCMATTHWQNYVMARIVWLEKETDRQGPELFQHGNIDGNAIRTLTIGKSNNAKWRAPRPRAAIANLLVFPCLSADGEAHETTRGLSRRQRKTKWITATLAIVPAKQLTCASRRRRRKFHANFHCAPCKTSGIRTKAAGTRLFQ